MPERKLMKQYIISVIFALLYFAFPPDQTFGSEPDTLKIFDVSLTPAGVIPEKWEHILPRRHRLYTNYSVERSIDGRYLRARSNSTGSWLELKLDTVDVTKYNIMVWQWKVDRFPDVEWEQESSHDDFALRIELVYDFKGDAKNPLNIIRKGLIKSIFQLYPPEIIISYVWSINVPSGKPYPSPNSDRTMVIPVESSEYIKGRWMKEKINIKNDLELLYKDRKLYLKKIRIRADTENSSSITESGLRYIYLIAEDSED